MTTDHNTTHMRIAALQCNFEGSRDHTIRVADLWHTFGFNVSQLFHTHAEGYSAVFDAEKHGRLLEAHLERERSHGIETILYMNCHILLESQRNRADEWAVVNSKGEYVLRYNTYLGGCLNPATTWMDYFLCTLETLRPYPIKGIFFDGPVKAVCYCERCQRSFVELFSKSMSGAAEAELDAFASEQYLNAKRALYEKVKSVNPNWIAYFNESFNHRRSLRDIRNSLACNDIVGTEGGFRYGIKPKLADIWHCSVKAKIAEAVAGGRPTVIFVAGDHKPWSWYLHTPVDSTLTHMSTIANGASVWYGLHGYTKLLESETGRAVRKVLQFDKQHDALYQNTQSASQVAIFYSFDTGRYYTSHQEDSDFYKAEEYRKVSAAGNYSDAFNGAVATVYRSGVPFDIVTDINSDSIGKYQMVLVPTAACMNENMTSAMEDYVANGGVLVVDSESFLFTAEGEKLNNFSLSELMGVDYTGHREYNHWNYFQMEGNKDFFSDGVDIIPSPQVAINIALHPETNVLAKLYPPLPGCYADKPGEPQYPFITRHQHGKGVVYYIAGTFFERYNSHAIPHYRKLFHYLYHKHVSNGFELLHAPESLEITVRRCSNGDTTLVHLVNYTGGMNRVMTQVAPLSEAQLKLDRPYRSIVSLVQNKELSDRINGNILKLPVIREYEVLLLR